MSKSEISRSWFCVFNNPAEHGYKGTPEEVCNRLRDEWVQDSQTRTGAWLYCISADGLHHVHMVLEDTQSMRFSAIKASYCKGMHFEPTKGSKQQVEDYIHKRGKFEEKGEQIVCCVQFGEVKGRQGRRTDLTRLADLIAEGKTPDEILSDDANAFRYKNMIKDMYFMKREKDTPITREVKVYWHVGDTGSGKSYSRVILAEEIGEDNIYHLTAYGSGAFDNYCGQKVLWIEDYRGEFPFPMLLRLLDVYKCEVPARYSNVKALWTEVHITSVLTPMQCYPDNCGSVDTIQQLLRRITAVIYHFKTDMQYYSMQYSPFTTYNLMLQAAQRVIDSDRAFVQMASVKPVAADPDCMLPLPEIGEFEEVCG